MPLFPPSRYSDAELPGVIADVCRDVDPANPHSVSQPAFDPARGAAGHPDAPTAKRMCLRLHYSWEAAKEFALDPTRNVDRTVGTRVGTEDQKWVTDEACAAALLTVAARLGKDEPFSTARYEIEAERMLAADRRRHVHGRRLVLPTVGQIEFRLGPWPRALAKLGLKAPGPRSAAGMAWQDAIELCLEATGCLVGSSTLIRWCELNELSLQKHRHGMSYPAEVNALRARRAAAGKWTPLKYTRPHQRTDILTRIPGLGGKERRTRDWSDEDILDAQVRFLRDRRGKPQTRRDYVRWLTKQKEKMPAAATMDRSGRPGFAAYRARARRLLREQENGQR